MSVTEWILNETKMISLEKYLINLFKNGLCALCRQMSTSSAQKKVDSRFVISLFIHINNWKSEKCSIFICNYSLTAALSSAPFKCQKLTAVNTFYRLRLENSCGYMILTIIFVAYLFKYFSYHFLCVNIVYTGIEWMKKNMPNQKK